MSELLTGSKAMLRPEPNIPQAPLACPGHQAAPRPYKDTTNFDVCASKCYDSKMPPTLAPPLLIDADNYMLRDARPRSLSHGALQRPGPRGGGVAGPLDLDMFCVRETVNSLAELKLSEPSRSGSPLGSPLASPVHTAHPAHPVLSDKCGDEKSAASCARTLSLHGMLCTCRLTCCCLCVSLSSPDCHACLHNVCARLPTGAPSQGAPQGPQGPPCQRSADLPPPITLIRNKVSHPSSA
ncbi:hypothetical protein ONE63_005550 [Megalurothrips usitatus]|uniref:Uncharacterized protein n=1 Tax=Megalurothrips usitatus TaxID=439358 RepID=A0AAV7Y224_9NEOP|nr:hypothetical protein ONE63_005550 [Megalurothrips usitatus]